MGDRWRHVQAVVARAHEAGRVLAEDDRGALIAAAWLHDVGQYSIELNTTTRMPGALVCTRRQLTPGMVLWDRGVEAAATYASRSSQSLGC
jgi:hypothetical protein